MNPISIIGAVVGFAAGYYFTRSIFFAFLLALLGRAIGSRLGSRSYRQQYSGSGGRFTGWSTSSADGPAFMNDLFSMLGKLAAADGHVSEEEEKLFRNVVINELRISSPESVASAMNTFRQAAKSGAPCAEYARNALQTFSGRRQLLELMLLIMIRVCAASNGIHPEEDKMLREIAGIFGYSSSSYESIKSRYTFGRSSSSGSSSSGDAHLKSSYDTLGVDKNASESEIRKAYRQKAAEYHPDKIAAKGLPKEFTEFANEKFQEIQKAWEEIRKSRGF